MPTGAIPAQPTARISARRPAGSHSQDPSKGDTRPGADGRTLQDWMRHRDKSCPEAPQQKRDQPPGSAHPPVNSPHTSKVTERNEAALFDLTASQAAEVSAMACTAGAQCCGTARPDPARSRFTPDGKSPALSAEISAVAPECGPSLADIGSCRCGRRDAGFKTHRLAPRCAVVSFSVVSSMSMRSGSAEIRAPMVMSNAFERRNGLV